MPRNEIVREVTLGQILKETVDRYPDEDAVAYVDREYKQTWREFSDTVDTMAKGLMAMGIKKGEKVAVWATNVPHWVALQFATARIGAILLTINTNYRSEEINYVLKQSDCENIFIINGLRDANYLEILYELIPELKTHPRGELRSSRYPCLKRVFFLGPEKHRGLYSMSEVMSLAVATGDAEYQARQDSLDPHDVINMQYTSGTTGFPKGVMLTHVNIGNNGYWLGAGQNFSHVDRICIPVPLFHCFGCVLGVLACVNHGATMVFVETYDPVDVMMSIEMEKCTGVYGVPTMFIAMMDHKLFKKFDFSSLRTGIMAGSPCPVKSMNDCIEKMNMREVTIVFGLTEASPGMTQTMYNEPSIKKKCETVGKAMPGIEVKVVDPKTGEDLPPGQPGEVVCRGYNIMKGYYKMEEATAEAIDKDGFLHSGDIGVMDEDGYFAITGRIKDMIIRGGENIYPKEIEDFLHHMDGVQDVQVVGVPSKKYGEQPGAFVIPYPDADISPQDVIDFCQGKIAWFKTPKFVHFLKAFPLTASGKVMKIKLREQSAELWPDV
ncbi:AMP-binding protein [Desulfopila sp. IMCC35006]|uniref:AMP-binding protein n=1 Tax=Desulfopila sp. IMCC35006 TaxID=2569542 RepID=UPI0010AB5C8D|nr:AMP-binding protein [Desulfopila sp. IMCC35006]TKB24316.1 AMP-binding protein [Desulfopila sp. IMCC35006]